MGIERPDWGNGSHTAVVPSETSWVDPDTLPAPSDLLAEMQGSVPAGVGSNALESLRGAWEKEGGWDHNFAQAWSAAQDIFSRVDDPQALDSYFERLPTSIQAKVYDHMRVPRAKGRAASAVAAFEGRLTSQERAIYSRWVEGLSDEQRGAIWGAIDGRRP